MNRRAWLATLAVSLGVTCTPAAAATYTSVSAFGDSLSDAGNFSRKPAARFRSLPMSMATSATARPGWKTCRKCWASAR